MVSFVRDWRISFLKKLHNRCMYANWMDLDIELKKCMQTRMLMYSHQNNVSHQRRSKIFPKRKLPSRYACSWKSKNNSIRVACLSWQIRSFKWNVYTLPEQETGCSRCWLLFLGRELWLPTYFRIVAESGGLVNLRWSAAFFQFMIYCACINHPPGAQGCIFDKSHSGCLCHEPGQLARTLRNQPLNASTSFWPAGSRPSDKRNHADYCLVCGSLPQPPAYWSLHYVRTFYDLTSQFLILTIANKF